MVVGDLILKLLSQDPDEIVTVCGCENFHVQNSGPFLIFDEKVLEETEYRFTSSDKPTQEEQRQSFKKLIETQGYAYTLAQVVQNEINCSFARAYNLVRDWIDEDDNEVNFVSEFFYKDEEGEI